MDSLTLGSDLASGLDVTDGEDVTLVVQGTATVAKDGSMTFAISTAKKTDASAYDAGSEAGEPAAESSAAPDAVGEDMGGMMAGVPGPVRRLMRKGK